MACKYEMVIQDHLILKIFFRKLPSFPNHSVAVKYAIEHRCGVRVRGPGLTDTITGTDPLKDK